jgi:hypothetical protein
MEAPVPKTEWEKNWDAVNKNPFDFISWEYLIKLAEAANGGITKGSPEEDITNLKNVYEEFLSKFPLCYAYWKKYADWQLSLVDTEKAEETYERGLACVSKSIDLWIHYLTFKSDYYHDHNVVREYYHNISPLDYSRGPLLHVDLISYRILCGTSTLNTKSQEVIWTVSLVCWIVSFAYRCINTSSTLRGISYQTNV